MNSNLLKYVLAVADEKSFTKAAAKLYIAQPSLSESIHTLESVLGTQLFDRTKKPLSLTAAGELYVEWAELMLNSEEKMISQISYISSGIKRKLTVGAAPYRGISILPNVISEFYEHVKNCTLIIEEKPYKELIDALDEGEMDLIVDVPPSDKIQYTSEYITDEKILVAANKAFIFDSDGNDILPSIRLRETTEKPVILLNERMYIGKVSRSLYTRANAVPNIVMECESVEMAHVMAEKGIGITYIPELYLKNKPASPDMKYYVIKDIPMSRKVAVVYRSDRYVSDEILTFTEILRRHYMK